MTTKSNFNNPLILAIETSGRMGSVAIAQGEELLGESHFTGPMRHSAEVFPAIVGLFERFGRKPVDIEQVYISVGPGSFTGLRIAVTIAKTMALANNAGIIAVDTLDVIAANVSPQVYAGGVNGINPASNERLATILDAKRGQFFVAVYRPAFSPSTGLPASPQTTGLCGAGRTGGQRSPMESLRTAFSVACPLIKVQPDCLMTAGEFLAKFADSKKPVWLLGEGLVYYKGSFAADGIRFFDERYWNPSAANVHRLGWQKAQRGDFADAIRLAPNYLRQPDVKLKRI
jgi:tRNA threonylcarbamoyl adenosine modification protein YeaZ